MDPRKFLTSLSADELLEFMAGNYPSLKMGEKKKEPEKRAVCVALLAHDDRMHLDTHLSLAQSMAAIAGHGWGFSYLQRSGDSMVARGRSFLASQFLTRPDIAHCTDLVYIDTDLMFPPDAFVRLCLHKVDVVGGAYPYKDESGMFPCQWSADGLEEKDGLWNMKAVTPGFFRVTRHALEKVAKEKPWLEFRDRGNKEGEKSFMFFNNEPRPTGIYDEGFIFCEHWRSVGGKVYLDPDLNITHIGLKKYNHGTIRQWLDKQAAEFESLLPKYPDVDPDRIMGKVMGQKIDLEEEQRNAVNRSNHARAPGITSAHSLLHALQHGEGGHQAADRGGRGRYPDLGMLGKATARPENFNLGGAS